jgi:hypothetical protein
VLRAGDDLAAVRAAPKTGCRERLRWFAVTVQLAKSLAKAHDHATSPRFDAWSRRASSIDIYNSLTESVAHLEGKMKDSSARYGIRLCVGVAAPE